MNVLIDYFQAGGPLMVPLCLLCFTIYLWILMLYPKLRRACAVSRKMQGLLHGLAPGEVRETVRAWAASNPGLVARVAQYAVGGSLESSAVRDRIAEARLAEVPPFQRLHLSVNLSTACPLPLVSYHPLDPSSVPAMILLKPGLGMK